MTQGIGVRSMPRRNLFEVGDGLDREPKVAACRRNLGLGDGIPLGYATLTKWLNPRIQQRSDTWAKCAEVWERWKIPSSRVVEKPWPQA